MQAASEAYLVGPPAWLSTRLRESAQQTQVLANDGKLDEAAEVMRALYAAFVEAQPAGHRFHKGWPLHNLGIVYLRLDDRINARRAFMCAFAEDAISRAEEAPARYDELDRPAAEMLLTIFQTPLSALAREAARIHDEFAAGRRWREPEEALADIDESTRFGASVGREIPPVGWRTVGDFGSRWVDRVFVAGQYKDHLPKLTAIRNRLWARGLDGVLVADFPSTPAMSMERKSLRILAECRRAVFEMSTLGSQVIELNRCRDFDIDRPLVIFHKDADKLNSFNRTDAKRLGGVVMTYTDTDDMLAKLDQWLRSDRRASNR